MRYNTIKKNDVANTPGICVSVYLQGCPHHCPNCFNPETWDFKGGKEFTGDTMKEITNALIENNIPRSLAILGGEPLCPENEFLTLMIILEARKVVPNVPVYIWTGYTIEDLEQRKGKIPDILAAADVLIDGPYVEELRDLSLEMRGSSNQRIIKLDKFKKI